MIRFLLTLWILITLFQQPLLADSWGPAKEFFGHSGNGSFSVRITPVRSHGSRMTNPRVVASKISASLSPTAPSIHKNRERREGSLLTLFSMKDGRRRQISKFRLLNHPGDVAIANNGKLIATFDDYGRLGRGENVVVIYGKEGKVLMKKSLKDILSRREIAEMTQSLSSIWWGRDHKFSDDGKSLVLNIFRKGETPFSKKSKMRKVRLPLRRLLLREKTVTKEK